MIAFRDELARRGGRAPRGRRAKQQQAGTPVDYARLDEEIAKALGETWTPEQGERVRHGRRENYARLVARRLDAACRFDEGTGVLPPLDSADVDPAARLESLQASLAVLATLDHQEARERVLVNIAAAAHGWLVAGSQRP